MMSDTEIEDLAEALYHQYGYINKCHDEEQRHRYFVQLRDDTIAVANVIHKHNPFYDMDEFYHRAGYLGVAPNYGRRR